MRTFVMFQMVEEWVGTGLQLIPHMPSHSASNQTAQVAYAPLVLVWNVFGAPAFDSLTVNLSNIEWIFTLGSML